METKPNKPSHHLELILNKLNLTDRKTLISPRVQQLPIPKKMVQTRRRLG